MKNVELKKRPLAPVLQNMKVGDVEEYPRSQYRSLNTTSSAISIETGMKFRKAYDGSIIRVERIA